MKKKFSHIVKIGLVFILVVAGFILGLDFGRLFRSRTQDKDVSLGAPIKPSPTPEVTSLCTHYHNEEFGISLCYPSEWSLPQEVRIEPRQQHLYRITLNPHGESYLLDIYDRPAPISLGSFVRDYFQEVEGGVSWTKEVEINGQGALQFFVPWIAAMSSGIGGVAFGQGHYLITLTTPSIRFPEGNFQSVVNDRILTQLATSFAWAE